MHPKLTGKGNGYQSCSSILKSIEEKYKKTPLRLTVAKFNERAIHLYENLGFVLEDEFHDDSTELITMARKCLYYE